MRAYTVNCAQRTECNGRAPPVFVVGLAARRPGAGGSCAGIAMTAGCARIRKTRETYLPALLGRLAGNDWQSTREGSKLNRALAQSTLQRV